MNSYLEKALEALINSGAQNVPNPSVVEEAKDGTVRNGIKENGSSWSLTKNNSTSFTVNC
jgi:hypothetical protein